MALHQIALIGRRMDTTLLGVKEFHPDVLHLLYTERTAQLYEPMVRMLPGGIQVVECPVDPYDASQVMRVCRGIRESLTGTDTLQYNLTEGTKVCAAAAFRVAEEFGDDVVYFSQEGEIINLKDFSRRPQNARISNEEFVDLFGSNLHSYNTAAEILPIDVVTAREVKSFIEKYQKTFQRIQHQYRSQFGGRIEKLPETFKVDREHNVFVDTRGGALTITDKGKVTFQSANPLATRLFFTGRWWEVLVSDTVYRWDLSRHANPADSQVWRNVEFLDKGTGKTKNELDVMVNDRRRLLMIECKSGYIAQENVYKIDSTRETYGGNSSKGILVSYYPLEENLASKCRDLHVYYFAPEGPNDRIRHLEELPRWLDAVVLEIE